MNFHAQDEFLPEHYILTLNAVEAGTLLGILIVAKAHGYGQRFVDRCGADGKVSRVLLIDQLIEKASHTLGHAPVEIL